MKILFDFDGTVTNEETIPYVAARMGLKQSELIADMTMVSSIAEGDYEKNLRKRIEMLKDITIEDFVSNVPKSLLRTEIVSFIKENADICELVSCNLDCWCSSLTSDFQVPCHFSKAIVKNGHVVAADYIMDKRVVVDKYKRLGMKVAFVGDSVNDLTAMKAADFAILFDNGYLRMDNLNTNCHVVESEEDLIEMLNRYIKGDLS